jgi:predicted enzyme related to lactoylglutathione lyase
MVTGRTVARVHTAAKVDCCIGWAGSSNDRKNWAMENTKHPTLANGKVCYLEIPANDVNVSASFYKEVFGWRIRERGDGAIAFDDGAGEVSGTWVVGRKAATEVGLLIYIMVDSVADTLDIVIANGGKIVQAIGMDAPEVTARFSDPAGNILGLYQERAGEN